MDLVIGIVTISFLVGVVVCHQYWKWYQSAEIKKKVMELDSAKVSKKFDLGGGMTFYRPSRLGKSQEGSEGKLHGISEINIIEHDNYIELFGAWNRNGKNQIDPYGFYLPTSIDVIDPDNIIEFGQYFVDLGNQIKSLKMHNKAS